MTAMTPYAIERDVVIDAPVETVWRTITEPDQVVRWFSQAADVEARPGAKGTLTFSPEGGGAPLVAHLCVVDVDRPHRYSFRWSHPDGEEPTPSNSVLVTFTLTADGPERTVLRVEETGLEALDWPEARKHDYADDHRRGWETLAGRLRELMAPPRV